MTISKSLAANVSFGIMFLMVMSAAPSQASELCDQIKAFANTPLKVASDGKVQPNWIEFHWKGSWLNFDAGWTQQCVPSESEASLSLCVWLSKHTSFEFPQTLPKGIMACYNYTFPPNSRSWHPWVSAIELRDDALENRYIVLETDFRDRKNPETAIRILIVPENADAIMPRYLVDPITNPIEGEF